MVFRAVPQDEKTTTGDVAVKFIKPRVNVDDTRSVRSEALLYRLLEPECSSGTNRGAPCLIYRDDYSGGGAILVTQLAAGVDAHRAFKKPRSNLNTEGFLRFLVMVMDPILRFHQARASHGDIKGANIMVDFDATTGEAISVNLVDFGLSCNSVALDTVNKDTCHARYPKTPPYMDPQYGNGLLNLFQADMYSVGVFMRNCAKTQKKYLSEDVYHYIITLSNELLLPSNERPTATQTMSALRRALYAAGDIIHVNAFSCTVVRYFRRRVGRCVLLVTGPRGEHWVLKACYTGRDAFRNLAEREAFILRKTQTPECGPAFIACQSSTEQAEVLLLEECVGEGVSLHDFVKAHGAPTNADDVSALFVALARVLAAIHKNDRAAILDFSSTDFVMVHPNNPTVFKCVDFGRACSIDMQRLRPVLCLQQEMNIFQQDVLVLSKMFAEYYPKAYTEDQFVLKMASSEPNRRPLMKEVADQFLHRLTKHQAPP